MAQHCLKETTRLKTLSNTLNLCLCLALGILGYILWWGMTDQQAFRPEYLTILAVFLVH